MKTIAITSGKGGVGKTNLTVNLGLALAQSGKRVLIFDADMGLANVDILFGYNCQHTILDVVDRKMDLQQILVDGPDGVKILPASSGVLKLERLSLSQLASLAQAMETLSNQFDILLIDTGAGMTESVLFFNTLADEVVLVTTPEPTALTDGYALIKVLATEHQVKKIVLVVNQAHSEDESANVFKKLAGICQKYTEIKLVFAGGLMKDTCLEKSVRARKPVLLNYPQTIVSKNIKSIANQFNQVFTGEKKTLDTHGFWHEVLSGRQH